MDQALQAAGKVADIPAGDARILGSRLQGLIAGERSQYQAAGDAPAAAASWGTLEGPRSAGLVYGRPAGASIRDAVRSGGGFNAGVPPRGLGGEGLGGGQSSPRWWRASSSALALLPGLFAIPLFGVGAVLPAILVGLASLSLAVLPWLGSSAPRAAMGIPGWLILALGAATTVAATGGWSVAGAAVVGLAGWGFSRFSRGIGARRQPSARSQMTAFVGALAAVSAAGLLLWSPAGWLAVGAQVLAFGLEARLLGELAEWFNDAVTQAADGYNNGTRGITHVLGSIRRDTVLRDRIVRYSRRILKQYGGFSVIGLAGIWIPIFILETGQFAVALAAVVAVGTAQAPILAAWGAFHALRGHNRFFRGLAVFFANWGRPAFQLLQGSKTRFFNPIEKPLLPWANSKTRLKSIPASIAIRLAQYLWLAGVLLAAVPVEFGAFFYALAKIGQPYDSGRHSLDAIDLPADPLPGQKPDEKEDPDAPVGQPIVPRLLAAGLGAVPAYFLGKILLASAAPR